MDMKDFFPERLSNTGRVVESASMEVFKEQLNIALNALLWLTRC